MRTAPIAAAGLLALATLLPLPAAAEGANGAGGTAATPQEAFLAARDAYRRGDFRAYIEAIAPAAHDECLCDLAFLLGMGAEAGLFATPEALAEANTILRRHGAAPLDPKAPAPDAAVPGLTGRKAIRAIPDKAGLYAELMAWLRARRIGAAVPRWLAASLSEVQVDGAKASARIDPFGTVSFEKAGATWLLHPRAVCLQDLFRDER